MATGNLQSLLNAKAALDLGLLNEEDYARVKESFLKAQQLRSAIDAGLIKEGAQVQDAREGFVGMVLQGEGTAGRRTAAGSVAPPAVLASQAAQPPRAPPPPAPPLPQAQQAPKAPPPAPPVPRAAPAPPAPPPAPPAPTTSRSASPAKVPKGVGAGTSMSGISLSEDAVNVFYQIRLKSTYRWVLWKINDAGTEVVIEKLGAPESTYNEFVASLPQDDCRYAVFDYSFVGGDGQQHSKIVFINWAPDVAKVKSKMMYASTKDFFKSSLEGLSLEFQGSDMDEVQEPIVGEAVRALKRNY